METELQVGGKGAFLPDAEGMYAVEGKTVRVMDQVASQLKADKIADSGPDYVAGADGAREAEPGAPQSQGHASDQESNPEFSYRTGGEVEIYETFTPRNRTARCSG